VFAGPNQMQLLPAKLGYRVQAPATRTIDGSTAVVSTYGGLALLHGNTVVRRTPLPGWSVVPAAASRTHVFVSTSSALLTFDGAADTQVMRFPWIGGGVSPVGNWAERPRVRDRLRRPLHFSAAPSSAPCRRYSGRTRRRPRSNHRTRGRGDGHPGESRLGSPIKVAPTE
jgi:hypothetical protein